jgi:pimeloyl-ACP methyl ester carboxylesterase
VTVTLMNLRRSCALVIALTLWVTNAVAANPPAPQLSPDPSLAAYAKPQQLIELRDGRRIHLFCLGKGSPTVILTAGGGGWAGVWSKVQAPIALKTRVCAWDRAGWGFSDPSSAPQDVSHTTADLEEALNSAKIDGPYVLVGHSAGSYESLLFADRHPRQVLGMVLIDPSFPDQDRRRGLVAPRFSAFEQKNLDRAVAALKTCAAELKSGRLTIGSPDPDKCLDYPPTFPRELRAALLRLDTNPARLMTEASTVEQFSHSSVIVVNAKRNYRSMPIRVLTAADHPVPPNLPADAAVEWPIFGLEWQHAHDAMAALSADGINTTVDGTSHYIQNLKPAVVISSVDEVIDKVRTNSAVPQKH